MALCCSQRMSSEDARCGLPEVGLGIIPAAEGTQTLSRAIGQGKALEMLLTYRWLSGLEAYEMGLVNQVVPNDRLLAIAEDMAVRIASRKSIAVRNAKQAVVRGLDMPLAEGLKMETRLAWDTRLA